ncbi:hypothetical protein Rt10032_c18g5995 [Rhodotorula toruloides]|uniref:Uncharacterized protein n=1 Tax=Rhodotorula toruloides TaxID=5286 RepID=A0A511KNL8_RHOTO|nr:hypothetical protein Rt10032_c18g5995 [Rhodotorula toruloides]
MDLSAGGLAPSSSHRTPGSSSRNPTGYMRFASPTARPEVSYTVSDTRTSTVSTTHIVHLATPPESQPSGTGKKSKGFALPQDRPLTSRVSPLDAQEKVLDSPGVETRIVEMSGSESGSSEEEMPPPRRSIAGKETCMAKTPPVIEWKIPKGARRASSAGPSGEGGMTAPDKDGQKGRGMSSPGPTNGSSGTENNTPTPTSGRQTSGRDDEPDQLRSSSPGPSQHGDDVALARPPASQQRAKGHFQDQVSHLDEGYATSSTSPASDPFVVQSDAIMFRDADFDGDFSQSQDTQTSSKRSLEAINEESEGDQNGGQLETPWSSQAEVEAHLLDSHRFTLQRSQSVMSTATEVQDDDERAEEELQMDQDVEGEEDQPEEQALIPAYPLAPIPSLFPYAKRPFFAHAQALAQVKKEEEVQSAGQSDAIQRWDEERNNQKVARHQSFQATIIAHSDKLSSGLGQESEAFQTMVDRLSSLWQLSGMQGTMWRRMAEMAAGGGGGGEGQEEVR